MKANTFLTKVGTEKNELPFPFRMQLKVDKFRLNQYKKLVNKIPDLEYKLANPRGWLADKIVLEATVYFDTLLQKLDKGKKLSPRKLKKMIKLQQSLMLIVANKIGREHETAQKMLTEVNKALMPHLMETASKFIGELPQLAVE